MDKIVKQCACGVPFVVAHDRKANTIGAIALLMDYLGLPKEEIVRILEDIQKVDYENGVQTLSPPGESGK